MDLWQGERPFILHFLLNSFNEIFTVSKRRLFFTLLDLEKAFNQVPREVICFVLRRTGVPEYLENQVISLY